jgi:hypothetical protein
MQKELHTINRSDITQTPTEALILILAIKGKLLSSATLADINTVLNSRKKVA